MHWLLPEPSTSTFKIDGTKGSALLLHGFTGSPYETRLVGLALSSLGFSVTCPLLPGHGADAEQLDTISYQVWLSTAEVAWASLPAQKPRILVGFSMGGALATCMAAKYPRETDGLVLLAPAFFLSHAAEFLSTLAQFGLYQWLSRIPKTRVNVQDPQARKITPNPGFISVHGLSELKKIRVIARDLLSKVECPVFAAYGEQDSTLNTPKTAQWVREHVKTPLTELFLPKSRHVLALDVERDRLLSQIMSFCETLRDQRQIKSP